MRALAHRAVAPGACRAADRGMPPERSVEGDDCSAKPLSPWNWVTGVPSAVVRRGASSARPDVLNLVASTDFVEYCSLHCFSHWGASRWCPYGTPVVLSQTTWTVRGGLLDGRQ